METEVTKDEFIGMVARLDLSLNTGSDDSEALQRLIYLARAIVNAEPLQAPYSGIESSGPSPHQNTTEPASAASCGAGNGIYDKDDNFGAEYIALIYKTSHQGTDLVMQFTCGDESRANYLAGVFMDTMHDLTGPEIKWTYWVKPIRHVRPLDGDFKLIRLAETQP